MILVAREKPILGMIESIRLYIMTKPETKRGRMIKRKEKIYLKILKKLEKAKDESASNIDSFASDKKFEFRNMYGDSFVVDLDKQTCTYRRWQPLGCRVLMLFRCISVIGEKPKDFIHPYHSKTTYTKPYGLVLSLITNLWGKSNKVPMFLQKR